MRASRRLVLMLGVLMAACSNLPVPPEPAGAGVAAELEDAKAARQVISGHLLYRERIALPPDSLAVIELRETPAGQGRVLAESRRGNPQRDIAADVVGRMEAALRGEGERLQALLAEGIETLLRELLTLAGIRREQIAVAAAAGNPPICHLLRRLPVEPLLFPPHRPKHREGVRHPSAELGLNLPVPLFLFPLVSGYVGGDLVAFLYAQPPHPANSLYLDLGTNGEIALHSGEGWLVTSVAAGPAFEGGGISSGMAVAPGAVTGVELRGDSLHLQVLGGGPPRGLAGSGLVEAVAAALEGGLIDAAGTIVEPLTVPTNLARCIVTTPAGRALRLHRDAKGELLLLQGDIRQFQLAKGAMRAGVECLLQRAGFEAAAIREVLVTGAFGFSLSAAALKRVAMLPEVMLDKMRFIPGGALAGVSRFMLDPDGAAAVNALAARLKPLPISGTPAFEKAFLRGLDFVSVQG